MTESRDNSGNRSDAPVALITGGSRGRGAGLVQAFLDAGYCVETCSRSSTETVRAWEDDPEYKERFHFTLCRRLGRRGSGPPRQGCGTAVGQPRRPDQQRGGWPGRA